MFLRTILTAAVLAVIAAGPAFAQQGNAPKLLGTFGVWNTYTSNESGQTVCYMVTRTRGAPSKKLKRGVVWLMITQRPAENSKDVVSYNAGYNFKPASDVKIHIGKDNFSLFTQKDTAWSRDAMTDHALATAIRKNETMMATGLPAMHGVAAITDTMDIKGAVAAYRAIGKACGMEIEGPSKPAPASKKKSK